MLCVRDWMKINRSLSHHHQGHPAWSKKNYSQNHPASFALPRTSSKSVSHHIDRKMDWIYSVLISLSSYNRDLSGGNWWDIRRHHEQRNDTPCNHGHRTVNYAPIHYHPDQLDLWLNDRKYFWDYIQVARFISDNHYTYPKGNLIYCNDPYAMRPYKKYPQRDISLFVSKSRTKFNLAIPDINEIKYYVFLNIKQICSLNNSYPFQKKPTILMATKSNQYPVQITKSIFFRRTV